MSLTRSRRAVAASAVLALVALAVAGASASRSSAGLQFVPLVSVAPDSAIVSNAGAAACTTPPPVVSFAFFHCYTPVDIRTAYGVDALHQEGTTGKGQTIVIVDSYGSPTALNDLQVFSDTFGLPKPDLTIVYPSGTPTYSSSMHGVQAGWAFETSLDLQWAHTIAPDAKLVLVAANPAETQGVQGFPSMFKGESDAVAAYPGSVISQSFAVTEQSFHSAADEQVARFDRVYDQAAESNVTVVSASGDSGTANGDKQGRIYPFPTATWPSSDPRVTSAGGTWLQYGWQWNPMVQASDFYSCLAAATSSADVNACLAAYLNFTTGPGRTEAVWKEDWLPAATGGAKSALFARPSFQDGVASVVGAQRGLPDVSWNAAVDGGVLVYTSFGGVRVGWHIVGGTSASTPQIAGLVALSNQLRAAAHKPPLGWLNARLYNLPAGDFNDIVPQTLGTGAGVTTLADNSEFGTGIPGSATTAGYDLTTGRGSPKAWSFVHDLAAMP